MINGDSPGNTIQLRADVVLEGGGVRGIGHVGALSIMEEKGYTWGNIAGTKENHGVTPARSIHCERDKRWH